MQKPNKNKLTPSQLFKQKGYPDDAFDIDKTFTGRSIIIYGAGECSHWFVEIVMKMHGYKPIAILDQSLERGDTYEGIPAFSPFEYAPSNEEKSNAIVVVCIGKQEYHEEIINCLTKLGFQNIIFLMDIYEIHNPFSLPNKLKEQGFDFYIEHKKQILECLNLFTDDISRRIYTRCLQTHMQRKPIPLPSRPREEQYFPKDLDLSKGYSRFINCGAYDGETIRLLNKAHGKVDDIVCFEPEPHIYMKLVEYLSENQNKLAKRIITLPCAVFSREKIMPFITNCGLGSRISDNGNSRVQCVTLDHVLTGFRPTFICMDVEGVELEVLKGAEKIIRQHTPDLAVCVYHSPDHLWKIPLFLDSLKLGYRFYLRNYTTFTVETVLYASRQTLHSHKPNNKSTT